MNTNIDRYKPVKYLVFTTNALRNNELAYDSNLSDRQTDHIMKRLTDFYEALQNNPNARITDLQERYLSWY